MITFMSMIMLIVCVGFGFEEWDKYKHPASIFRDHDRFDNKVTAIALWLFCLVLLYIIYYVNWVFDGITLLGKIRHGY